MLAFFPIFIIAIVVIVAYWIYYFFYAITHNDKHNEEYSKKLSTLGTITFVVIIIGCILFGVSGGGSTFIPIPVSMI